MFEDADGNVITKCDQCRQMWKERNERGIEGEPPCDTCRVLLDPANENVAKIYLTVRNQVITRFNGQYDVPVGLDHNAVWNLIDHFPVKIEDPMECFERVISTFHHFLKKDRDNEN